MGPLVLAVLLALQPSAAFVAPRLGRSGTSLAVQPASNPIEQLLKGFQEFQETFLAPKSAAVPSGPGKAAQLAEQWASLGSAAEARSFLGENLAEDVQMEDLSLKDTLLGKAAVVEHVASGLAMLPDDASKTLDIVTDGEEAAGWTWILRQGSLEGLRGLTFIELDAEGKVSYIREGAEPLFKLGGQAATLLKAVLKEDENAPKAEPIDDSVSSEPQSCSDVVRYLWLKAQFVNPSSYALNYFSDDIVYEDLNFKAPFRGTEEVAEFLKEFEIPGLRFLPEKISDGKYGCAFTWKINIGDSAVRGLSLYTAAPDTIDSASGTAKINYIRDIPEPAVKPPPVLELAKKLRPGLQTLEPRPIGGEASEGAEQDLDAKGDALVQRIVESGATEAIPTEFYLSESVLKASSK